MALRFREVSWTIVLALVSASCQAVLGIEDGVLVQTGGASGAAGAGGRGPADASAGGAGGTLDASIDAPLDAPVETSAVDAPAETSDLDAASDVTDAAEDVVPIVSGSVRITTGNDDVWEDDTVWDPASNWVWVGTGQSTAASYTGFRFQNVTIPRYAAIQSAALTVCAYADGWVNVGFQMYAHASNNSAAFSGSSRPSQRNGTTAVVVHSANDHWFANSCYTFEDVSAVVQQIVSRTGWSSGNALTIILHGTAGAPLSRQQAWAYEGDPVRAAKLDYSYR